MLRTLWLVPDGAARQSQPFVPLPPQLLETLRVSVDLAPLVDGPVLALAALAVAVVLRVAVKRTSTSPTVLVAGAALLVWGPAAGASTWTGSGVAGATLAVVVVLLGFVAGVGAGSCTHLTRLTSE